MRFFLKKNIASIKDSGKASNLNKNLTTIDIILLGLGVVIGTGVFALTGLVAAKYSGPAVILSYAIAGFTCMFVALTYTELIAMLPTSGSIYSYTYVAFGEMCAWMVAGIVILEFSVIASAVSGSWSAYMQGILRSGGLELPQYLSKAFFDGGLIDLPALFITLFVGFMTYLGTKESKKLNSILVLIKMSAISLFLFFAAPHFDIKNWDDFMPYGFDDVLTGASILFFAFTGFGALASSAEECKNPKKDLTIGIIGSLAIATIVYGLVGSVLTGMVPYYELNNAEPLAYALKTKGNNAGSIIVAVGALAGMTTVMMVNIYGQSRVFYVVARDGLLPKKLTTLHQKYDSPYMIIGIFTMFIALLSSLFPYSLLAQLGSMGALTDYLIVGVLVMFFRIKHPNIERPFTCPALFIVAPIAIASAGFLLCKQIISKNGLLLLTGKIFFIWMLVMFGLYLVRVSFFKKEM